MMKENLMMNPLNITSHWVSCGQIYIFIKFLTKCWNTNHRRTLTSFLIFKPYYAFKDWLSLLLGDNWVNYSYNKECQAVFYTSALPKNSLPQTFNVLFTRCCHVARDLKADTFIHLLYSYFNNKGWPPKM